MTVGGRDSRIDTSKPHPARRYNYWLGGKDHFAADRESGDAIARQFPSVVAAARANREFLGRAVHFLAAERGVRQFLDIGTGLPAPDNTHEVAQRVAPDARVLYVDNDPIVLTHARALLCGDPRGRTDYLEADVRDPAKILEHPTLAATLDLAQPVAVLLVAVLHFLRDDDEAADVVRVLRDALAPGSFLVLSHFTMDFQDPETTARYEAMYASGRVDSRARSLEMLGGFFGGAPLEEPGLVSITEWRTTGEQPSAADVSICGGIGRIV